MDEADHANDLAAKQMEILMKAASNMAKEVPRNDTGKCLWCEEPVEGHRRWCSAGCRESDELQNRRTK